MRRHPILTPLAAVLPLAALIATLPLWLQGPSCGHDFAFHLQSWLDAAAQFRHGTLAPEWAFSAAYNAGEPRFLFYPPLSWTLGALLTMLFPIAVVPALYTLLALTAAGLSMFRLARHFATTNAALLVATLYLANPYMLFNAFERTAYAELLAAAWLPLLLLAALRARPSMLELALPIALLWLTNAPAAVIGCYALAVIVILRLAIESFSPPQHPRTILRTAAAYLGGTLLGLTLPAFYLLPAAHERRFVQIAMAIIPNIRFQDNFLFGHDGDAIHDAVLHTASLISLGLLLVLGATLSWLALRAPERIPEIDSESPVAEKPRSFNSVTTALLALMICVSLLLTPLSTPLWNHLPDLAFLQFPWRFTSIVAAMLGVTLALVLRKLRIHPAVAISLALALAFALSRPAIRELRQPCPVPDRPAARAQQFALHRGVEPTDEYTPKDADNDVLRADDPPFWLSTNPASFAPHTTPNPYTIANPTLARPASEDATPAPPAAPLPTSAPFDLIVETPAPEFLILNLRRYPGWLVTVNGHASQPYVHDLRDDGLIVIPLDAGQSALHVTWHRGADQRIGTALTLLALIVCAALLLQRRSRSSAAHAPSRIRP
jgi:hypothetical protein